MQAAPKLLKACRKAESLLDALLSFYGQGLEVANWLAVEQLATIGSEGAEWTLFKKELRLKDEDG